MKGSDAAVPATDGEEAAQADIETAQANEETAQADEEEDVGDSVELAGPCADEEARVSVAANLFQIVLHFVEGCDMENIRAFNIVYLLKKHAAGIRHFPEDLDSNERDYIQAARFHRLFRTDLSEEEVYGFFLEEVF